MGLTQWMCSSNTSLITIKSEIYTHKIFRNVSEPHIYGDRHKKMDTHSQKMSIWFLLSMLRMYLYIFDNGLKYLYLLYGSIDEFKWSVWNEKKLCCSKRLIDVEKTDLCQRIEFWILNLQLWLRTSTSTADQSTRDTKISMLPKYHSAIRVYILLRDIQRCIPTNTFVTQILNNREFVKMHLSKFMLRHLMLGTVYAAAQHRNKRKQENWKCTLRFQRLHFSWIIFVVNIYLRNYFYTVAVNVLVSNIRFFICRNLLNCRSCHLVFRYTSAEHSLLELLHHRLYKCNILLAVSVFNLISIINII